ncbi:MAG: hypothetical protein D6720_08245 [Gammaproteobacteria bacterium]|nr:MAG: hypothetical protein D6720_08245 [Gammaproteobacteria bacterium]
MRIPITIAALVLATAAQAGERWYSQAQVDKGRKLFAENCAGCHGDQAQGLVADWKKPLANGSYPPPPLNGTAHAWHHPMAVLKRQIRVGGKPVGGVMPAFGDKLGDADMDAIIAYIQSKWPDNIYAAWSERSGLSKTPGGGALPAIQSPPAKEKADDQLRFLRRLAGDKPIGKPAPSPVKGIDQVTLDANTLYITQDGQYAFVGNLIDLKSGRNLTAEAQKKVARKLLDAFGDANKVIFRAKGKEKAVIDVLTDTSCPYCRKLHAEVPKLQQAGVTVRYIPYPRGGAQGPGYDGLRRVWCAADPAHAMTEEILGQEGKGRTNCSRAALVDEGYRLGNRLGIQGTPTIFLPDGTKIGGYLPADQLLERVQ